MAETWGEQPNIEEGVIAAGVPCKVIREITDEDLLDESCL